MVLSLIAGVALHQVVSLSPPDGLTRTWLGPEFWANNLQDWEVRNGKYICHETRQNYPIRTAQIMTLRTSGSFEASVDLDSIGDIQAGWQGLLIGSGGDRVDYRITALVHNTPAEDGGLLVGVDETGKPFVRDFSVGAGSDNGWSLSNRLDIESVPEFPGTLTGTPATGPLRLRLSAARQDSGYELVLRGEQTGLEAWTLTVKGVPHDRVDGMLGFMSHHGGEGHTFDNFQVHGPGVHQRSENSFGPVTQTMWTMQDGLLKLTALGVPLGQGDPKNATLEVERNGVWVQIARSDWDSSSFTYHFKVSDFKLTEPVEYRVRTPYLGGNGESVYSYAGWIVPEPKGHETKAAVFTCFKSFTGGLKWNGDGIWAPHQEIVDAVNFHDPDILIFTGDQIYEGDLTPARLDRKNGRDTYLDYLSKYYRFAFGMGSLTRRLPSILIPDDHDVYHGNIWGAGGKQAMAGEGVTEQDSGGYKASADFVNAVHKSLTSHMPDPYDSKPVGELGLNSYTTEVRWGGVSFAVLADRMFKDSATVKLPEAKIVNGWSRNPDFDMASDSDVPTAQLLGPMQERFLAAWAKRRTDGIHFKAVVSQTIFHNPATIPDQANGGEVIPSLPFVESPLDTFKGYKLAADTDSHGWPQTARNRALRLFRQAGAINLAGDQHLATLTEYGIDRHRDGGFAFCVPAAANTWPRRWYPPVSGLNRAEGSPEFTGDFIDGFGNKMTVWAVANPYKTGVDPANLYNRTPGYGIVRFNKKQDEITFECWPRWVNPASPNAKQYLGWPKTIKNIENSR